MMVAGLGEDAMDQVLFGLVGVLIGLAVLYGVVRLAISPRKSWMAPPSGRADDSLTGWNSPNDMMGGHDHHS